ncbi:hypothetical protein [Pseudoalteromonas byunsanensis]|uniref:Fimbrial-type adhesion domain-containing protein n=1 Tax=Pseudoalteromonas byunsanensis TaxID=327939 RepID=A0A1S1NBN3_9GAMM|nr:hypothetical protein [Pseudoalteromonas byunsanensis]OHU95721.1 hypothetical protein BIW53_07755 [Pseudoalteromonas byunsanensis]
MRKPLLWVLLVMLPIVGTSAKEFGFQVNYEAVKTVLEIIEVKKLQFPDLLSDNSTEEGAYCSATGTPNPNNSARSLCPGLIGQPGVFDIVGAANATIVLTHTADHTINGLRLTTNKHATPIVKTLRLNASGTAEYVAQSMITLVDKDAANSSEYYFTFDISVAYQ